MLFLKGIFVYQKIPFFPAMVYGKIQTKRQYWAVRSVVEAEDLRDKERQKSNGNSLYEFMVEQAAFTEQQDTDAADGSIVYMYEYRNQFMDRWTDGDYTEHHSNTAPADGYMLSVISTERTAAPLDKK